MPIFRVDVQEEIITERSYDIDAETAIDAETNYQEDGEEISSQIIRCHYEIINVEEVDQS